MAEHVRMHPRQPDTSDLDQIVNIASTVGLGYGVHGAPEYAAAKAAVIRMSACLAPPRHRRGIRINCVCPSLTDTPRRDEIGQPWHRRNEPPHRPCLPKQVADAVLHTLTDENLAGRVLVCQYDEPRTVLLPALDWSQFLHAMSNLPYASRARSGLRPVRVIPEAAGPVKG